jgi:hypothetical protein
LKILADAAIIDESLQIRKSVVELFARITSRVTNDPSLWILYAHLYQECGQTDKALECRMRTYRALQTAGWEQDASSFGQVAKIALEIARDSELEGSKQRLFQAKMMLQNLIMRGKDRFGDDSIFRDLKTVLKRIETSVDLLL